MHLKPVHYSALGLGVTAVVAVVGVIYYRNAAAAQQGQSSGTPLFQTAAIPQFMGAAGGATGGGGSGGGGGTSATQATDIGQHLADLAGASIAGNTSTALAGTAAGVTLNQQAEDTNFTNRSAGLFSQIIQSFAHVANNFSLATTGPGGEGFSLWGSVSNTMAVPAPAPVAAVAAPAPYYQPPPPPPPPAPVAAAPAMLGVIPGGGNQIAPFTSVLLPGGGVPGGGQYEEVFNGQPQPFYSTNPTGPFQPQDPVFATGNAGGDGP